MTQSLTYLVVVSGAKLGPIWEYNAGTKAHDRKQSCHGELPAVLIERGIEPQER
jgi:hypothetical protein